MMETIIEKVKAYNRELRDVFQLIFDELNKGQTQKLLKNPVIQSMVEKYHIEHK